MMRSPGRPPLVARMLAALIVGADSEVLRGDLEETYDRRLVDEGDSLRLRMSCVADAARSAVRWWWSRPGRRYKTSGEPVNVGEIMLAVGPELRQMWRGLVRRPGYVGMVALTLGLGIGATTTIYSVVDAMLVRPLPYRDADRLVVIGNTNPTDEWIAGRDGLQRIEEMALPNFQDLRGRVGGVQRAAAIERRNWLFPGVDSPPEIIDVANVEAGFFDLLSVKPVLGRLPRDGDQAVNGGDPWGATISFASWQRRFGADPNVIGRRYGPFIILGVLPREFLQPAALVGPDVEFWVHLDPNSGRYTDRSRRGIKVLARLEPGVPLTRVRRDLAAAQTRLAAEEPGSNRLPNGTPLGVGVNALRDATVGTGQRPVLIFFGAALLLLVLAGTNAANLLIVRGLERDGELSLRSALGAGRARLAASLVTESVALALAGGAAGLGIAMAGVAAFRRFGPQSLPRMTEVVVNFRIVVVGALLSIVVGVLVGLIPAVRSSRVDPLSNLRGSFTALSPRGTHVRTFLAATQLAVALMLGVGASLLFRSFVYLRSERLGFEPNGLVTFSVAFKTQRPWEDWTAVLEHIATIPGVTSVAGASSLPFQSVDQSIRVAPSDQPADAPLNAISRYAVSPAFFVTAKIPVLRGRAFDASDQPDSRRVVIINERYAQAMFPQRDPIGQRLRDEGSPDTDLEVVGVVGNVVQARVEDGMLPAIYVPYTQTYAPMTVVAATRRSPEELMPEIRRAVADAGLRTWPVVNITSMDARIGTSLSAPRFQLLLIGAFAGAAVLLAAIGLYGTLAFTVRSRTRELGIRMAMGATQRQIFELVLGQGVRVLAVGLTVGVIGALGLTRLLHGFLYRVSPIDPIAFLAALAVVICAVLVAAVRPAGRAARVDPIASIRSDIS